jgi:hypothetical protein
MGVASCDMPVLLQPRYTCNGSDQANVEFLWTRTTDTLAQVIDVSLVLNGFADGTFVSANPVVDAESFIWTGLRANETHYYRLNALTSAGWHTSVTRSFVPACPIQ